MLIPIMGMISCNSSTPLVEVLVETDGHPVYNSYYFYDKTGKIVEHKHGSKKIYKIGDIYAIKMYKNKNLTGEWIWMGSVENFV